jgi:hypothetical protein
MNRKNGTEKEKKDNEGNTKRAAQLQGVHGTA